MNGRKLLALLTLLIMAGSAPGAALSGPKRSPEPVIFVHGCFFSSPSPAWALDEVRDALLSSYWGPMLEGFRAAGYPQEDLHVLEYSSPCADGRTNAEELAHAVNAILARTGRKKVDLVAHSMGCISARLYASEAGRSRVDDIVSLAGTCHGTRIAGPFAAAAMLTGENEGAVDLDPPYACAGVQRELNGCFGPVTGERLFPFDETPGGQSALSIYTDTDELNDPPHSACLEQARMGDCTHAVNRFVIGRSHFSIHQDADVVDAVVDFCMSGTRS